MVNPKINNEIKNLVDDFSTFDNWEEKYSYIIDLGKKLPKLSEEDKIEENKVSGCVSQVWLITKKEGDKYYFRADSDAFIVKGLIFIVLKLFSEKTKEEILTVDFEKVFDMLDMKNHISQSRSNGIFSVVKKIKETAESNNL
ncbi:MAG: cysteine desulfuration protein SufE [Candidatus Midichloriaceae bacterium]|jgi:cysteine desulfuration protein SufE